MELSHDVASHLCDFEHLLELLGVARDEVQEGEALKVLGLLVGKLDDLVVTLPERLDAELVPSVLVVELLRGGRATSMLPHSMARSKRVRSSFTK